MLGQSGGRGHGGGLGENKGVLKSYYPMCMRYLNVCTKLGMEAKAGDGYP